MAAGRRKGERATTFTEAAGEGVAGKTAVAVLSVPVLMMGPLLPACRSRHSQLEVGRPCGANELAGAPNRLLRLHLPFSPDPFSADPKPLRTAESLNASGCALSRSWSRCLLCLPREPRLQALVPFILFFFANCAVQSVFYV